MDQVVPNPFRLLSVSNNSHLIQYTYFLNFIHPCSTRSFFHLTISLPTIQDLLSTRTIFIPFEQITIQFKLKSTIKPTIRSIFFLYSYHQITCIIKPNDLRTMFPRPMSSLTHSRQQTGRCAHLGKAYIVLFRRWRTLRAAVSVFALH